MHSAEYSPEDILELWFPDNGHQDSLETHGAFWTQRMQGGMDATIIDRFGALTQAAAKGELDSWAETPRGRLALLIVLDQFPRSLWRDTPSAFAQDIKAARLALEGIENGHFDGLAPWEQKFYTISISHCEGPDHIGRMIWSDNLVEGIIGRLPDSIAAMGDAFRAQHERVKGVIAKFGRHPHRNDVLGRISTPEEQAYVSKGDFPHNKPGNVGNDT